MEQNSIRQAYLLRPKPESNYRQQNEENKENDKNCNQKAPVQKTRHFGADITQKINSQVINLNKTNYLKSPSDNNNLFPQKNNSLNISQNQNKQMDVEYSDPQQVIQYHTKIMNFLRTQNIITNPLKQNDITEKMRQVLIDWIIEVHLKFNLQPITLYLTVGIIDSYLDQSQIIRSKFQLLGITALLIACKFEEVEVPNLKNLVYITNNSYDEQEVIEFEGKVLNILNFKIYNPTRLEFFQMYLKDANMSQKQIFICMYILELSLVDYRMKNFSQEIIAVSCIYLVKRLHHETNYLVNSNFAEQHVKECALQLLEICENQNSQLNAVKNKYAQDKFLRASRFTIENQ